MVNLNINPKNCFLSLIVIFLSGAIHAQDIHYSQFNHAPLLVSPSLTGIFDGESRITANYRAQWNTVPVGYRTLTGTFDTKAFRAEDGKSFFGLGVALNLDEAGDTELGTLDIGLNGSYTHQIFKSHWLTAGVQLRGIQRRFKTTNIRTDNQFQGGEYNPGLNTGENFNDTNIIYGDFAAGINWRAKRLEGRTTLDVGLAMHHINQPVNSFFGEETHKLPNRKTWYGFLNLEATASMDIVFNIIGNYQGPYTEHLAGAGARLHLSQRKTKELSILFGLNYRWNANFGNDDVILPTVVMEYQSWRVGVSYDVDISSFNGSTAGNGGPELSLRYLFKNVGKPDFCPTCPTYL